MKRFIKASTSLLVVFMLFAMICFTNASAATGTGYTKTGDIKYQYYNISSDKSYSVNNGIKNWGARGEVCVFLSPNAVKYYTGNNTFDKLSVLKGGTNQTNSPGTALYEALQDLMDVSFEHNYGKTRDMYQYTDCVMNQTSKLVSFYSGNLVNSAWDGGVTYNREHCWPDSKCLNPGRASGDSADMMMLRPTVPNENGSRGNTAYGTKANGYYEPNDEVKGDCARIVLYGYVRYGNTSNMWGKSGVMENMTVLLKWMQQDPVDTWEMGRNDAVESISGNRNVFVDYPEFAWLLFGKSVPTNMTTPSSEAKNGINPGTETGGNTSSNQSSSNPSSSSSTGNVTSDRNDTDTSNNNANSNHTSSDNATSGVGAIENKPQNEGKPFDPSNLGGTTALAEDDDSAFEVWMIIVPIAVVLAAVIAVAVVIIIRQKKVK